MPDAVLALNAGSSSVKFALFDVHAGKETIALVRGQLEGIDTKPHFFAQDATGVTLAEQSWDAGQTFEQSLEALLNWVETHLGDASLLAVGHRVVHGGAEFTRPVLLTLAVIAKLEALTPLAPLHQPRSLAPVRAILAFRPELPQVACFDTAFHHTMRPVATRLALPFALTDEGVRRYGFHGLSYEYIAGQLRKQAAHLADGRVVVAHLGNGASLCAMQGGRSVDTTMGFTALDGLMMGTRCGTIDPGVVLYLLQQKGLSADAVEDLLYKQSGLLGVSGLSSDMRALLASPDRRAREAIDLFIFRIVRETGALASTLGGVDAFVFTAGIGEHAPEIRSAVTEQLRWLGDFEILVIPTDEETMIGRHTLETIATAV